MIMNKYRLFGKIYKNIKELVLEMVIKMKVNTQCP